jgi:hypothetical protein
MSSTSDANGRRSSLQAHCLRNIVCTKSAHVAPLAIDIEY